MAEKPKIGDIRPVKKLATTRSSFGEPMLHIKDESVFIKKEEKGQIPKTYNDYIQQPKSLQKKSKVRKYIIILAILFLGIYIGLYFLSHTTTIIIPKDEIRQINQSVTLDSWTTPLKSTTMSVHEKIEIKSIDEIESVKSDLEKKLNNHLVYDMPKEYLLMQNCKSNITYTEPSPETISGQPIIIEAEITALIFEKNSLEDYLIKITAGEDFTIKDISALSCDLRSNIQSKHLASQSVSFILTGDIILLPIIHTDEIITSSVFKTHKSYDYMLSNDPKIASYTVHTTPGPIFPVLPKNTKHIHVLLSH